MEVELHARLRWTQSYTPIGGSTVQRLSDGAGHKQSRWRRTATVLTCEGWIPPGLGSLDYAGALEMRCVSPRAIAGPGTSFTLPAARRSDSGYEPFGFARLGDEWLPTAVMMTGDQANLDPVTGADSYRVLWYPQLMVLTDGPEEDTDGGAATYRWRLAAEEA
ncbi:hypothetical protein [Thioalkalivibrio sulfidiphilus]|uniref:hypothetical protein n=1 Tax=Thioalkalivibrio sulfidiphilus TaxID=1033854 RepID=UPI0011D1582A|nr:hypothetical protein [Thioalkalivibrio sulfidiphilus]